MDGLGKQDDKNILGDELRYKNLPQRMEITKVASKTTRAP